ncbi:hypothetical protein [Neptuniibacter sp. QD37_11]|uniref:hypothetical protein n=1 Tax=Neptuniibacter sp. QD37_11 TaxID=3398209 RepID=UPI0039F48580
MQNKLTTCVPGCAELKTKDVDVITGVEYLDGDDHLVVKTPDTDKVIQLPGALLVDCLSHPEIKGSVNDERFSILYPSFEVEVNRTEDSLSIWVMDRDNAACLDKLLIPYCGLLEVAA